MNFASVAAVLSLPLLSACSGGGLASSTTLSQIAAVSGGTVNKSLNNEVNNTVSRSGVGTVVYVTGSDPVAGQMVAAAGISGTPTVGAARTSGGGTYTTSYRYGYIANVARTATQISGYQGGESGVLTLTADFDAGTLSGSNSELTVNGTISGPTVGGSVTANYSSLSSVVSGSVDGTLAGEIGVTGVIGTFHGSDSDTVMAGGLVGVAN